MSAKKKTLYEELARFLEAPTREGLRDLLKNHSGELPNCDFKSGWPAFSKVARHILGIANSRGGCIIIGVAEKEDKTLEPVGIKTLVDKSTIFDGVKKHIPNILLSNLEVLDLAYDASEYPALVGKRFQVVIIPDDPVHLPFVAAADGEGIRNNAIYIRRGPSTEEANNDELQRVINCRLDTGYSSQVELDLQTHIEQLKILYGHIAKYHYRMKGGPWQAMGVTISNMLGIREEILNSQYPEEGIDAFIARMIAKKKKRIELELDVIDSV